ncbi:MAG: hypothetical protein ACRDKY_07630 [Solirubrobacteraceae bacterium]
MRRKISGTRLEVAAYLLLAISLAVGALLLSDLVLAIGAGMAAVALFGALSSRLREPTEGDDADR